MQTLFPPGDTNLASNRHRSAWREFSFVFEQVKRAIVPDLSLNSLISNWSEIIKLLSEGPRKRNIQLNKCLMNVETT